MTVGKVPSLQTWVSEYESILIAFLLFLLTRAGMFISSSNYDLLVCRHGIVSSCVRFAVFVTLCHFFNKFEMVDRRLNSN